MKTIHLAPLLSAFVLTTAFAQSPSDPSTDASARTMAAASARDGFTLRGTEALMTRGGITTKMEQEVRFPNGLRVLPDGTVTLPDGSATTLRPNQLLTFEGAFHEVSLLPAGVAPLSSVIVTPAPAVVTPVPETTEVGISARDGISVSGADVFITRNGVMEKVTSELRLANDVVVQPDGTIISNGNKITIRANQVLGLDGVLRDAPVTPNPAGPAPGSISPSR